MRVIKRGQQHPIGWALRHNRREKEIWVQHSSLSVSWQCLQYDQIPHDPVAMMDCAPLNCEPKLTLPSLSCSIKYYHRNEELIQQSGVGLMLWWTWPCDLSVFEMGLWYEHGRVYNFILREALHQPLSLLMKGQCIFFSEFSLCLKRRFQVFRVALTSFWEQGLLGWVWAPGLGAEHSLPKAELLGWPLTSFYSAF